VEVKRLLSPLNLNFSSLKKTEAKFKAADPPPFFFLLAVEVQLLL